MSLKYYFLIIALFSSFFLLTEHASVHAVTTTTKHAANATSSTVECTWSNPTNATGDTTQSLTSCNLGGGPKSTGILTLTNFGFSQQDIPIGASIEGVQIEVEWNADSGISDTQVHLTKNGSDSVGTNKATSTNQTSKAFTSYGSNSDAWGASLTDSDLRSTSFGIRLQYSKSGGKPSSVSVYRARTTVIYSMPTVTLASSGDQLPSVTAPANNQYLGGAFTLQADITGATLTALNLTQAGSLDTQYLSNIDVYYETTQTCQYDGTEALFGTAAGFSANDTVIAGSTSISTDQICFYVTYDLDVEAVADETIDLQLIEASDVVIDVGQVAAAQFPIAISGLTTIAQPAIISVSVSPGSFEYGLISSESQRSTLDLSPSVTQIITNESTVPIDLQIRGAVTECPWQLATTAANNQYIHKFSLNAGQNWNTISTEYAQLISNFSVDATADLDLQITTPTTTNCFEEQSVPVTIQAVEAE